MKASAYLVAYKDSPKSHTRYFGPFVSIEVATRFMDELPHPQPGGAKDYRVTQPFTVHDTSIIHDLIMGERERHVA